MINMKQLQYLFFKLLSKVFHNNEIKHNFLRRQGIQIGRGDCLKTHSSQNVS